MNKPMYDQLITQCTIVNNTCAATKLRHASRAVNQVYALALAPSGLQPTQFSLLVACALTGSVPITELAEALVIDRTTLTRNLKPLQQQGLVHVGAGDDRRVRLVGLTEQGQSILAKALPLWEQAQAQVAAAFGQERLSHVLHDVAALAARVQPA